MKHEWRDGNEVRLLENGEEFFPRVFEALREARRRVYIETFILLDDEVGRALLQALAEAVARGAAVDVLADGFGSEPLTADYRAALAAAGVRLHLYEPRRRLFGLRTNLFRRLHRKIVLIDGRLAFVGGINFCSDQLLASGPLALHDFAVELRGPIVADIERFVARSRSAAHPPQTSADEDRAPGPARVRFVTRDNHRHPGDIEREYRVAIRAAQREIVLANAYFFPGYRLLRDLRNAARRGVRVTVVVQGKPDLRIVPIVVRWLYHYLIPAGVRICEFRTRPLHAKVAVVDGRWATVGSSNLDPLSLSLNLEANVVIVDAAFGAELRTRLLQLLARDCVPVTAARVPKRTLWRIVSSVLVFHFLRHFPRWVERIPAARPRIEHVEADAHADR
ncbi:cardiolipin synthase ClsB [Tahibacter caeni]|uniref:cardiolipin synthase ClsB n=1 Tax=Tahibacter caeni TaxID=1453545 RepID=UPI00214781D7|nr:cardiolipin synthase ClsB [Tahibacter caeni]